MKITIKHWRLIMASFGLFALYEFSTMIYTMLDDQETSSKIPLKEYNNLFSKETQDKLQILATVKSRNREPISTYIYDTRFNLCVLKVILFKNSDLKNVIKYQNRTSYKTLNATYSGLPSSNFDMSIKAGKSVIVSLLYFKFSGDSIKSIVKNDSLYCYYLKFKTFSINYNNEPYDVIGNADESNIPASIAFKKRGDFLYIIIITVAKGKEELQPGLLYSLINK
jgi:hypothetical protein